MQVFHLSRQVAPPDDDEAPTLPDNKVLVRPYEIVPVVLPEEQQRWRRAVEFQRALEEHAPLLLDVYQFLLISINEEKNAVRRDLMMKLNLLQGDIQRLQVQLASCSAAAMGLSKDIKRSAYAWSQAYDDVRRLRDHMEKLRDGEGGQSGQTSQRVVE
jgi:hypothetical protein